MKRVGHRSLLQILGFILNASKMKTNQRHWQRRAASFCAALFWSRQEALVQGSVWNYRGFFTLRCVAGGFEAQSLLTRGHSGEGLRCSVGWWTNVNLLNIHCVYWPNKKATLTLSLRINRLAVVHCVSLCDVMMLICC